MRVLGIGCIGIAAILAGGDYALRRIAIAQIVELTGAMVTAESVRIGLNGTVSLQNVTVSVPPASLWPEPVLTAHQVRGRFNIASMLRLHPKLCDLKVRNFRFNALYDPGRGRWNLANLKIALPRSAANAPPPTIRLENGTLSYGNVRAGKTHTIASIPLAALLKSSDSPGEGYDFRITTATRRGYGPSRLEGHFKPGKVVVTGSICSTDVAALQRVWTVGTLAAQLLYDSKGDYSLKLSIKDLLSTRKPSGLAVTLDSDVLLKKTGAFAALQRFFARYRPAGKVDLKLNAAGNLYHLSDSTFDGTVHCRNVSICDRKFPYRLEHLTGEVRFTPDTVELKRLTATHGSATVTIAGNVSNLSSSPAYDIHLTGENIALDNDLYAAVNENYKKLWSTFSPRGSVGVDYRLSKTPMQTKKKTLNIRLNLVHAVYRGFAYPLHNLRGEILFDERCFYVRNVVADFNDRTITINGKTSAVDTDRRSYSFVIDAKNVPVDAVLAQALAEEQRRFLDKYDVRGLADAHITVQASPDGSAGPDFVAIVSLRQASLKVRLPRENGLDAAPTGPAPTLAVSNGTARLVLTPRFIGIEQLRGRYYHSSVSLQGRISLAAGTEPPRYNLRLAVRQLPLDDRLTSLLPRSAQKVLSRLRPEGNIDLTADLCNNGHNCPVSSIVVRCLGNSVTLPADFGGLIDRLEDVTGQIIITEHKIELNDIQAKPALADATIADASLAASGEITLPDADSNQVDFKGRLRLENCPLDMLLKESRLSAPLDIRGSYRLPNTLESCHVIIPDGTATIRKKVIRALRTELHYEKDRRRWLARELTADFYGARLLGRFEIKHPAPATPLEYLLEAAFENADLGGFLADADTNAGPQTKGDMSGSLSVVGTINPRFDNAAASSVQPRRESSRIGRCRLTVRNMQAGALPPLVKLLNVLRFKKPGDYAFDRMVLDSYVKNDNLFIKKVDLAGPALALTGSGRMHLPKWQLNLLLYARGRRLAAAEPTVLESLTENIGSVAGRIEVTGDIHDPTIITRPLPVIEDTLRIFRPK